jgi:hypothetical protein
VSDRSPAQIYAGVIGATLVIAGVIGFFYSASFGAPGTTHDVFGVLSVNAWHNIVHILTGVVGLVSLGYAAARSYALVLGVVYVAIAIWGFILGDLGAILGFIPVNTEDSVLHAAIGLTGLFAYAVTPAAPDPGPTAPGIR